MRGIPRVLLVALSCAALGAYVYVAMRRMSYPYDLEWIEGAILQHVERVEAGESLYDEPSAEWTALLYAPLYYLVCVAFTPVFDTGLPLLRGVSFAASLGTMALAYVLVHRETASRAAGVVAAGLFAALYDQSGGWFDLARVDSLMLLLLMAAILVARWAHTRPRAAAAGALIVLATYSKQQALIAAPALFLFLLLARRDRGPALAFAATTVGGLLAAFVAAEAASDGWFSFYFAELGGRHPYAEEYLYKFFTQDLGIVAPALLVSAVMVWRWRGAGERELLLFYVPLGLALGLGSFLSRIHEGGFPNVVLPAYLFIALLAGLAIGRASGRLALGAAALLVVQFALLAYDPGKYIPSDADRARSERAVAAIRALPGDVYVSSYPIYGRKAGKREYVHTAAAIDVIRAEDSDAREVFRESYDRALEAGCFSHVIGAGFESDRYRRVRPLLEGETLEALSGLPVPIGDVHVPRGGAPANRASCPTPPG
jgi:hypothetical protein